MWQRYLKDYFSFSASDRNGIIFLCTIIVIIILGTWFVPRFFVPQNQIDYSQFSEAVLNFYNADTISSESNTSEGRELFYFDPNNLTRDDMRRLGFSDRLSRTVENYLLRGGRFVRKEDMMKIYGMTDSMYASIHAFIRLDIKENIDYPSDTREVVKDIIDLNHADSMQLRKLPGIGTVLSKRIILYRELLGGFYHTSQLTEVYGISDELYNQLKELVTADTNNIIKIDILNASFNDLLRHPYINYNMAGRISGFVKNHQHSIEKELLLREGIFDSIDYQRLKPYLEIISN